MSRYRYPQKFEHQPIKDSPEIADIEDHISAELSRGYKYGLAKKLRYFLSLFSKRPATRKQPYR